MSDRYVAKPGGVVEVEPDLLRWAGWYEETAAKPFEEGGRRVDLTELADGVYVSTVFLALNHSFGSGPPALFETMIFGGSHDYYQERYATAEEAREGHRRAVELAEGGGT
ncbi:MAG TPA: hypothetical protein VM529_12890 [Gemmata sp.]|nr:hypothetical protein [Gemmata sp.]